MDYSAARQPSNACASLLCVLWPRATRLLVEPNRLDEFYFVLGQGKIHLDDLARTRSVCGSIVVPQGAAWRVAKQPKVD